MNVERKPTACTIKHSLGIALFFLAVHTSQAQGYLSSTGSPTFNMAFPVEGGFIDLSNGNLHIEIPIYNSPQRGKIPFSGRLVYDSRIWQPVTVGGSTSWQPTNAGTGGWRYVTTADTGTTSTFTSIQNTICAGSHNTYVPDYYTFSYYWTDPYGTTHFFPANTVQYVVTVCNPNPRTGTPNADALASDSTGYHLYVTNYAVTKVLARDGSQVYPTVTDPNGNYFSFDGSGNAIDTLGRTPVVKTVDPNNLNIDRYDYLSVSGSTPCATSALPRACTKVTKS